MFFFFLNNHLHVGMVKINQILYIYCNCILTHWHISYLKIFNYYLLFHLLPNPSLAHTIKMCSSTFPPIRCYNLTRFGWVDSTLKLNDSLHIASNTICTRLEPNKCIMKCQWSARVQYGNYRKDKPAKRGENYYVHYNIIVWTM